MKTGFDEKKYLKKQREEILKRVKKFNNKLYLEVGGKLIDDYHLSRCLPGFKPNLIIELLKSFKKDLEIIFCINAADIEKQKIREDYGITYDMEVIRLITNIAEMGLSINSIVITQYTGQPSAESFKNKLERNGIKVYIHTFTKGYPTNVEVIVSDEGYGANPYIETSRPIVVVTSPGAKSGKLGTCLSQLYHEYKRGIKAGYAKYEKLPVWDLPLKHPINMAYEASTADAKDVNMIDPFHLEAYKITSVNYNRDIEVFPVLKSILESIMGKSPYKSPTDMGVNLIGECITNNEDVKRASRVEIIRRYYKALCSYKEGNIDNSVSNRIKVIMNEIGIDTNERIVIKAALEKTDKCGVPAFAIQVGKNKVITGRETDTITAPANCFINAIKHFAKIADEIHLLSPVVLEPMIKLKKEFYHGKNAKLNLQDVILGLSISEATNPTVAHALSHVKKLRDLDAHSSFMIASPDQTMLRNLGINYTSEAEYYLNNIYLD